MATVPYPTRDETSPSLAAVVAAVAVADYPFRGETSPDGTMTVVFTDVEGSTRMMEELGETRWLKVMRDHNKLLKQRVTAHNGKIVKSIGDGYMVVFASASAAMACAIELQKVFQSYSATHPDHELRVRIGMHTGNVFQEESDFLGRSVVVAARIAGRARGGEVLVSHECKQYTERAGRWAFGPASEVSLKGLSSPQRVHSVLWGA